MKKSKRPDLAQSELVGQEKESLINQKEAEKKQLQQQDYIRKLERIAYDKKRPTSPVLSRHSETTRVSVQIHDEDNDSDDEEDGDMDTEEQEPTLMGFPQQSWTPNRYRSRLGLSKKVIEESAKQPKRINIKENDLVFAKNKLKKVDKTFKPVKMNREDILKQSGIYDCVPYVSCQNAIRNTAASADLVSLNLSGIDQLTDAFFYFMYVTKLRLPSLKTFFASGCSMLSDEGIRWFKLHIPQTLEKVHLNGCRKLTEQSLYHLTKTETSPTTASHQQTAVANVPYMEIQMMATSVRVVPKNLLGNSSLSLKLDGCPLVSPPIQRFKAQSYEAPPTTATAGASLPVYKVVILRYPDMCSEPFAKSLPNVHSGINAEGVTFIKDYSPGSMNEKFNIIEINCGRVMPDVFLSEGSIVLVPFTEDKMEQLGSKKFITALSRKICSVMYKCLSSTFVLTLLSIKKPAEVQKILNNVQTEVHLYLRLLHTLVDDSIKNMTMKKWKIEGLDYLGQEYLGMMVRVKDMTVPDDSLSYPFIKTYSIPLGPDMSQANTRSSSFRLSSSPQFTVVDMFKMAVQDVSSRYPWFEYLQSEAVAAVVATPRCLVAKVSDIVEDLTAKKATKILTNLHPTNASACLFEIIRIMYVKGQSIIFDKDTKSVCTDMTSFCDLITKLHSLHPMDPSNYIRCITHSVCFLTEEFLIQSCQVKKEQIQHIIDALLIQGYLLQLPCDALDAPVPYMYVLTQSLSVSTPDDIAHFWPDSLGPGDVQAERFYHFTPDLPAFFIPFLLHHFSKVTPFKRVWQNGALISQAPVDIILEVIPTPAGVSLVYLGARIEKSDDLDVTYACLWGALKVFINIIDYLLLKHKIFANITVPCQTCLPDRNRYKMADTSVCHHFAFHSLQCGFDRGPQCRVERQAEPLYKQTVALYIGSMVTSVVPHHNVSYLAATKNKFFTYSRCFQCRRCALDGVTCPGSKRHGLTPNHCSCGGGESVLCPCCGICQRCIRFMAEIEAVLFPSFSSRRREFVDSSAGDSAVLLGGSIVNGNHEGTTVQCLDWMTPEYFNRIDVTLLRGTKLALGLNLSKVKKEVTFELNSGVLNQGDNTYRGDNWKMKEGDTASYVLRSQNDSGTMTLDVLWNDHALTSLQIERQVIQPYIIVVSPASFMLHTHGIRAQKQLDTSEVIPTYRLSEKMCLEYTRDDGEIVSARITGNNLQNITLITDHTAAANLANAITLDSRRPKIHPPGYARHHNKPINGLSSKKFDWIEEIKSTPYVLAPHWLFTEGQQGGCTPLKRTGGGFAKMKCTDLLSPAVLECQMSTWVYRTERTLYETGGVNYSGTAIMTLPRDLSVTSLKWPSRVKVTQRTPRQCFPLCYIRGDSADMLSLRPSQPQPTFAGYRHPYWNVHFVNAPGFPYPEDGLPTSSILQCFWNIILKFLPKITLPNVDKMFPEFIHDIPHEQLERCIEEYAHIQAMSSFLRHGLHLTPETFRDVEAIEAAAQDLQDLVVEHIDQSGLTIHSTTLTGDRILICDEHLSSLSTDRNLNYFPIEKFPQYSQFIASLIVDGNKIHTLPDGFFDAFPSLLDFQFSLNGLRSLPRSICQCRDLFSLRLGANHLIGLPDELVQCEKLCRLEISANLMDEVPPVVMKLKSLERLYIQQMQLAELPENIGDLENLQMLYASGNCFNKLPPSFANLQKLNDLALNGVAWFDLRRNRILSQEHFDRFLQRTGVQDWMEDHDVDKAALYQYVDEDKNGTLDPQELSKLNAVMFLMFPRFGYQDTSPPDAVDCTDRGLHSIPEVILGLQNLEYLSLQYQGLVCIASDIERLSKLTVLNLAHNPYLTMISASTATLPLKRLELDGCPSLKTPPKEILARGFTSTFAYLKRLLSGSNECKRTKLMLVGLGGAGKTSLVKALLSANAMSETLTSEDITDGIDITDWTVQTDTDRITYSVWDFAGQTVYYNTHQFFLTERSVYLLLWNIRLGHEHAGLDFWLSSITVHAPNAPIFVIGTHLDQVSKSELPMAEMLAQYPNIVGFHFISSFTGKGVRELQTHLLDVTLQQLYMGERIPGVWLNFETAIINERVKESVIQYRKIEDIAANSGIFDKSEVMQAVQFLHDLGSLQHFNNQFLHDHVVINPQWIVDVMACVVSVKDSPIQDGRFNHSDIGIVWKDYPQSLHQWLLRLTEEFDLTFPLKDEDVNLVPCLLPETQPEFDWPELNKHSLDRETKMIYKFSYLPAGLFNRAQVRLYQISDSSLIWKKGSFLRKNDHIALLRQSRDNEMIVKAQGVRPGNILLVVHEVFEGLISESFRGVTYDFNIPCPDCLKTNYRDPHMFAASTIRRASELTAPFLQCLKYFHTISIIDLLATMPPDTNSDYDIHIVSAVRGLKNLKKDLSADVFVSFSPANVPAAKEKVVDPHNVCKDLEKTGYKCWYKSSAKTEPTLDEMAKALMDCKIFVAFMSNDYVRDKSCVDIFKYARLVLGKPIVLITVDSGNEWKSSTLGILMVDEVYVNMRKLDQYSASFDLLLKSMREKVDTPAIEVSHPAVFVSYAWQNSQEAVTMGARETEGAIGAGDPRLIKSFLEENGVRCWIDVERVGVNGLFEDIAAGLLNSKVMVACVSDAYAASPNCQIEFRFAANTLKLPIVLAVVGTTNAWRGSEIGILSVNYNLVSFQEKSASAPAKLVELVKAELEMVESDQSRNDDPQENNERRKRDKLQKDLSFQELFELAQRKFMRQIAMIAEGQDLIYPRLIVADFKRDDLENSAKEGRLESVPEDLPVSISPRSADSVSTEKHGLQKRESTLSTQSIGDGKDFHQEKFCFHILCEHEQGWHSVGEPVDAPEDFGQTTLHSCTPYLARITAIIKYNRQLMLKCMLGQEGDNYLKWLEKSPQSAVSDFDMVYKDLRNEVFSLDHRKTFGNLSRCHLPNGKTIWLCEKHLDLSRVTVLSGDAMASSHTVAESSIDGYMLDALSSLDLTSTNIKLRPSSRRIRKRVSQLCLEGKDDSRSQEDSHTGKRTYEKSKSKDRKVPKIRFMEKPTEDRRFENVTEQGKGNKSRFGVHSKMAGDSGQQEMAMQREIAARIIASQNKSLLGDDGKIEEMIQKSVAIPLDATIGLGFVEDGEASESVHPPIKLFREASEHSFVEARSEDVNESCNVKHGPGDSTPVGGDKRKNVSNSQMCCIV